jgi:hypothetical protein
MIKMIQFLEQNKHLLDLVKDGQLCLLGIDKQEEQAILNAFHETVAMENRYWR